MTKTEADIAKLTHRQREVLTALAGRLSNNEVTRLLRIAEATANIDAKTLLQAYATVKPVLTRPESSTIPPVSLAPHDSQCV